MKKDFDKSMCNSASRIKTKGHNKPLRSIKELAEEFGYTSQKLASILRINGGPKRELKTVCGKNSNAWYEPTAVREFIKQYKADSNLQTGDTHE